MNQFEPTAWACIFFTCPKAGSFKSQKPIKPNEEISMSQMPLEQELKSNSYPGRGIVIGRSDDGTKAVTAYFIVGRSANNYNHVFVVDGEGICTQAFNPAGLEDPNLIIYAPVWALGNETIMTNEDQIDTIYDGTGHQMTLEQSLRCRELELDASSYTPRISGILHIENGNYNYIMSILRGGNANPDSCLRFTYAYQPPVAGEGRPVRTYICDGSPFSSSGGEFGEVGISGDIDTFTDLVWNSFNEDNKVPLFTRYIDIAAGTYETKIVSKNK